MDVTKIIEQAAQRATKEAWKGDIPVGSHVRQGDVYFTRIERISQTGEGKELSPDSPVAVANSHLLFGTGVIHQKGDGTFEMELTSGYVDHPEHRTFNLPAGCYRVSFQTDLLTKKRVVD